MFKFRVLTFTIIISFFLFYSTPIGSFDVKANEIEYTQRQLQDVGAWFIGERLLEGAIENFNFDNLPTDLTADDFLADLGAIIVDANPDPLLDDLGQAADDIWNGIEKEIATWTSDDAWSLVKDTFYTLWYDVNPPTNYPLADILKISDSINEQLGVYDRLLQYANEDEYPTIPPDFSFLENFGDFQNQNVYFVNSPYELYFTSSPPDNYFNKSSFSYANFHNSNGFIDPNNQKAVSISNIGTIKIIGDPNDTNATITVFYENFNTDFYKPSPSNSIWCNYISTLRVENGVFRCNWSNYPKFPNSTTTHTGLSSAINYVYAHYRNANLYINDTLVYSTSNPQYPVASTNLTYPNYEPAKYSYPEGTSVDWNRLYTIIYNAVRDGIVLDFGDLEDCFVDVNGQTAVATLGLVRNDYDNLVQEQFTMVPYPRFNDNLWLTNLAEEMTEPAQNGVAIIENAYNIFPIPLQKALLFSGALLLFGLLIRRFLE